MQQQPGLALGSHISPELLCCAPLQVRTGCGKSQVSRYIIDELAKLGKKCVLVRHPMVSSSSCFYAFAGYWLRFDWLAWQ